MLVSVWLNEQTMHFATKKTKVEMMEQKLQLRALPDISVNVSDEDDGLELKFREPLMITSTI